MGLEFDGNIAQLKDAFWTIVLIAGPLLLVALLIGLAIGILQAATSINEMTLSFVPKILLVLVFLAIFSGYMMSGLTEYFSGIFQEIANIR
ncbi:MAG: flagellar biosynthesis protein FliQ [Rhodospirillaceae bacterium]|jgi:flagellar biosynthetic protein FliQ